MFIIYQLELSGIDLLSAVDSTRLDVLHYNSGLILRTDPFGLILLRPEPCDILSLSLYGPTISKANTE